MNNDKKSPIAIDKPESPLADDQLDNIAGGGYGIGGGRNEPTPILPPPPPGSVTN